MTRIPHRLVLAVALLATVWSLPGRAASSTPPLYPFTTVTAEGSQIRLAHDPALESLYMIENAVIPPPNPLPPGYFTTAAQTLIVWDTASRSVSARIPLGTVSRLDLGRLAIDPVSHTIYVVQTVSITATTSETRLLAIDGSTHAITASVVVSSALHNARLLVHAPSESLYAFGSSSLYEMSLSPGSLGATRHTIALPAAIDQPVIDFASRQIYGSSGGRVIRVDGDSRTVTTVTLPGAVNAVTIDPTAGRLYVGGTDEVSVLDPGTLSVIETIAIRGTPVSMAFDAARSRLWLSATGSPSRATVIDLATAVQHEYQTPHGIIAVDEASGEVFIRSSKQIAVIGDELYLPGPSTVTFTAGNQQATLEWTRPIDGGSTITAYNISVNGTLVGTVPAGTFTFTVTGLQNGSPHTFAVTAVNEVGDGGGGTRVGKPGGVFPVAVGASPYGVGVDHAANRIYVANRGDDTVSVIDGRTWTVTATIPVGDEPHGVAVDSATGIVYVTHPLLGSVSRIDGPGMVVTGSIAVGAFPHAMAIDDTARTLYVANGGSDTVSVISLTTNTVTATVPVGSHPYAIAVDPGTHKAYVVNVNDSTVSIVNAGFQVTATLSTIQPHHDTRFYQPLAVAVDPVTHTAFVGGYFHRLGDFAPVVQTIDGTDQFGEEITSPFLLDMSYEHMALNPVSGYLWSIWEREPNAGTAYFDRESPIDVVNRVAVPATGIGVPGPAGAFTDRARQMAVDPVRNIVYVTGDGATGGVLVAYHAKRRSEPITIQGAGSGAVGSTVPLTAAATLAPLPVTFSVDAASAENCSHAGGGVIRLTVPGACTVRAVRGLDANFEAATATHTITVGAATPTIAWEAPEPIVYGTALGDAQLNAGADVPGTFTYSPTAGTVLAAGTHTLSVSFTPDDTANYTNGSAAVSIVVLEPEPEPAVRICGAMDLSKPARAGSTIPVKLRLCDASGATVSSPSTTVSALGVVSAAGAVTPASGAGNSNPGGVFRLDDGQYVFNLKTTGLKPGAYRLLVGTSTGVEQEVPFVIR